MHSPAKFTDIELPATGNRYTDGDESVAQETSFQHSSSYRTSTCTGVKSHIVVFLFAFLLGLGTYQINVMWHKTEVPREYARVDSIPLPTTYKQLFWWTEYSDQNDTEVDALWENMNADHGIIAVDREWAMKQHWPQSMAWPTDPSKNIYVLEGYHLLHCLTIIRKSFWEAVRDQPSDYSQYTYDPSHSGHCLDAIRQHIICDANPTPLYSFMRQTVGDRQPRQCRDWNALRTFATKNSACYKQPDDNVTHGHVGSDAFKHCPTQDDDGIIVNAERRGNWD